MPLIASRAGGSTISFGGLGASLVPPYLGPFGAYDSIATTSVGTAVSSVTFSSIPANYTHLQVRGIIKLAGSNTTRSFFCQVGNGTAATTGYSDHFLQGDGSATTSSGAANGSEIPIARTATAGHSSFLWGVFVIDIVDYANTSKFKTLRSLGGYEANGTGVVSLTSGNFRSTSAIDTIKLFGSGENISPDSFIALYGIKGA